jgi:hypothetical protein
VSYPFIPALLKIAAIKSCPALPLTCVDMSEKVASLFATRSGDALTSTAFSKAARLTRGIVGVVDAAGSISAGDEVTIEIYETPSWLLRTCTL